MVDENKSWPGCFYLLSLFGLSALLSHFFMKSELQEIYCVNSVQCKGEKQKAVASVYLGFYTSEEFCYIHLN